MTRAIYTGDLEKPLVVELSDKDGPIDITQPGTTVRLVGVQAGEILFARTAPAITVDSDGQTSTVTMPWQVGDTDTPGRIEIEVEIIWPGSRRQTVRPPEDVRILVDLG